MQSCTHIATLRHLKETASSKRKGYMEGELQGDVDVIHAVLQILLRHFQVSANMNTVLARNSEIVAG
ncbi:hypothetical protein FRX31_033852, partial [Thalictrum thalictroides]